MNLEMLMFQKGMHRLCLWGMLLLCAGLAGGCGGGQASLFTEEGTSTWYGKPFHGRKTASGETFDMGAMTAAHPRLAFGTKARVTNLRTNRSVVVRINDHYPSATNGRIIDVSRAAFKKIANLEDGVVPVRVEVIEWPASGKQFRSPRSQLPGDRETFAHIIHNRGG